MATASEGSSKKEKIYDRETKSQKPSTSAQKDPKGKTGRQKMTGRPIQLTN